MIAHGRRPLPTHITAHRRGYLVRVIRGGVVYRASVPQAGEAGLARALELRDRFLKLYGETVNRHRLRGKSNTGWSGISETTHWGRNSPSRGLTVCWREHGRQRAKRFTFLRHGGYDAALREALAFRLRVTRLNPDSCPLTPDSNAQLN